MQLSKTLNDVSDHAQSQRLALRMLLNPVHPLVEVWALVVQYYLAKVLADDVLDDSRQA